MQKGKVIIQKEQVDQIDNICKKLHNTLTPLQIRNWLENFLPEEFPTALRVIENLKYFTLEEIINEYDQSLRRILDNADEKEKIFLHGLGKFGKSGSSMIYFVRQTPTYKSNEERFKILDNPDKLAEKGVNNNTLVLIDDIIGSGKSLLTYYREQIKFQFVKKASLNIKVLVLCVVYMKESLAVLEEGMPDAIIYGTQYIKAFASGSSVFGYRPKMLPVRELCYHYGKNLFSKKDWKTGKTEIHPLGFNKSQSLIVFAHSVPNNTLPIIWSSKNDWFPLYPRSADGKVSRVKEFQKETWLWINVAYKLRIFKTSNTESIYTKNIDFSILAIVRLKKQKRIIPIICQILGITLNQYNEIITIGKERNIFDLNDRLTEYGLAVYEKIKKSLKIHHQEGKREKYNLKQIDQYVPKKFLGRT